MCFFLLSYLPINLNIILHQLKLRTKNAIRVIDLQLKVIMNYFFDIYLNL